MIQSVKVTSVEAPTIKCIQSELLFNLSIPNLSRINTNGAMCNDNCETVLMTHVSISKKM